MNTYYKEYGIREYLLDLIDLGYTSKEILDIIKVGDIQLTKSKMIDFLRSTHEGR